MRLFCFVVLGAAFALTGLTGNVASAQKTKDDGLFDNRTVKEWIPLLEDKDRKVRYAAVAALAKAGPKAEEAVPALEKMQKDTDPYNQSLANYALAYIRPDANINKMEPAELLAVLKDKDKSRWSVAAANLAKLGPKAAATYDDLVGILKNDNESYRRALAAYVLPYLKPKSADAATPLAEALKDKHKDVAKTAGQSLVNPLGAHAAPVAPMIVPLFSHEDAYRRALACYVIMNIEADKTTPGLIDGLIKLTKDKNENVKQAAREALKKIDPEAAKREGVQ